MKFKEEIISFLKKKLWYIVLLILSTIYVFYYRYEVYQLKELNAANLIFILWLVLLLLPLFSEMEFFGIKLKKELEKTKAEVKENINDLHAQINDLKITNSNANTINLGNGFLPTEQKLKELIEESMKNVNMTIANKVTDTKILSSIDFNIAEESTYLFKVRLMLEKTLTDLCDKTDYVGRKTMHEMMRHLKQCELINGKTVDVLSEIIKIASRGIHGEIVSKEYIDFIKQVYPGLQSQLNEVNARLNYYVCPKCKYTGYSRFENECPKCGFINDDY